MTLAEFLALALPAAALVIPWFAWTTKTLIRIDKHTAGIQETLHDHERRLDEIEKSLPRPIVKPAE